MGLGLPNAYGAEGAYGALDQILSQRIQAKHYADQQAQQQLDNAMRERQFQSTEELKRAQLESLTQSRSDANDARVATEQDRHIGLANSLADQIPAGSFLPPTDPAVGMLRTGGRGSLLTQQDERPKVDVGPLLPGDTGAARQQGFIKSASQKQTQEAATEAERTAKDAEQHARDAEIGRHNKAMEAKPAAQGFITVQTMDDQGRPVTRVVPKTPGTDYVRPPSAQQAQQDRATKDTLSTLSQLDQAIDNAKDLIGPGMGRISNLEQMAGSADPRIQALGVKMKAAKMQVDHAITGSVRAAASPTLLQQWDNILANKITPEGLKAGVQAMREILGGGQAQPTQSAGEWIDIGGGIKVRKK